MLSRSLVASFAVLASLPALAAPVAAQSGRDLLAPQSRAAVKAERLGLIERAGAVPVRVRSRGNVLPSGEAVRVSQPATEIYSYDDDSFGDFLWLADEATGEILYEMEFAQRFRLRSAGTVEYAEACFARFEDDTDPEVDFVLTFYSNDGGSPGDALAGYNVATRIAEPGSYDCFLLAEDLVGEPLPSGDVWVAVSWLRGTPPENTKRLATDLDSSGGRRAFRARVEQGGNWEPWQPDASPGVYGIRLAVDHPDPMPDPEPEPDPEPDPDPGPPTGPGYTDCVPETTPLLFEGGYRVQMCYETPAGDVGEGKAGIWASGESGLLWFFNRGNAEVLIKVLSSACDLTNNEHVWVFVAPVTDLAFNLHVTDSEGQRTWSHRNRQGDTASTRSDTRAFPCN